MVEEISVDIKNIISLLEKGGVVEFVIFELKVCGICKLFFFNIEVRILK